MLVIPAGSSFNLDALSVYLGLAVLFLAQVTGAHLTVGQTLSIDWFVGIPRAVGNMIGNCVARVVVAAWEGEIDLEQARIVLEAS